MIMSSVDFRTLHYITLHYMTLQLHTTLHYMGPELLGCLALGGAARPGR